LSLAGVPGRAARIWNDMLFGDSYARRLIEKMCEIEIVDADTGLASSNEQPRLHQLGELQGKLDLLEIRCHRCERRGQVNLARLIDEHGAARRGA